MNSLPVVRIHPQDRERRDPGEVLQRGEHPPPGLVRHRSVLRPAGGDVGDCQGVAVIPNGVATLVPDQVDLDEPGHRVVPLRPRPDRDRVLEQRAGLVWDRPRSVIAARSGPSRRSIVAGDIALNAAAMSSSMSSSPNRRRAATSSAITGASRLPVGAPSTAQQNRSTITTSSPYSGCRGRRGRMILGVNALAEGLAGVAAVPAGRRAQLVENLALGGLVRPPVPRCDRLGHRLTLAQSQSHHRGLPRTGPPARQARCYARIPW